MENKVQEIINILSNTTTSYKFYFFKSIIDEIVKGQQKITYNTIIRNMIFNSWYTVADYKLSFGEFDELQKIIIIIKNKYKIKINESPNNVKIAIEKYITNNKIKNILNYVPYLLISSFCNEHYKGKKDGNKYHQFIILNAKKYKTIYHFNSNEKKKINEIFIDNEWFEWIQKYNNLIYSYIDLNLINFLEIRNKNVSNIISKLTYNKRETLSNERKLFNSIIKYTDYIDIYEHKKINELNSNFHVDHFIPWTYTLSNDIWNLTVVGAQINIIKSNKLPSECHLSSFYKQQYKVFKYCKENNENKYLKQYKLIFNKIDMDSLNEEIFTNNLQEIIESSLLVAKNLGFETWKT